MKLKMKRQEKYSRFQLLLRSFFGLFYIGIPHWFLLFFLGLWGFILGILVWWVILFTAKYPKSWFEYQVKLMRWQLRLNTRLSNLLDGYPAFGLNAEDPAITFEVEYPETLSRLWLILKAFFGIFYVWLPHGILLLLRYIVVAIITFLAWFVVLFTAKYPESWFNFQEATIRWQTRVNLYMSNMTDQYPPFSGAE